MSQIASWELYSSLYPSSDPETFAKYRLAAEDAVESVIGPIRYAQITEQTFGYDKLQKCICRVIDQLRENDSSGKGRGVSSVSNDGYSESYAVQTSEQVQNELIAMIISCLAGTGLVGAY